MKRIFALILTCCFFWLGGISASAETLVNNATVYPSGTKTESAIGVAVISTVSRYAVDMTFDELSFTADGSAIWNVNTLRYEYMGGDPNIVCNVTLVNYSDKAVYVWGETESAINDLDIMSSYTKNSPLLVSGAPVSNDDINDGVTKTMSFTADPKTGKTWNDAIISLMASGSNLLGTVSVVIAKEKPSA